MPASPEFWGTGLPPERPRGGMAMGCVFEEGVQGLLGLLVLFRRSRVGGGAWSWDCARAEEMMGGRPLLLERIASRTDFISGGMGMLCTMLTVGQSAGCMSRCSLWVGGRQQPGQPWLLNTVSFGFERAHCDGRGEDGGDRRRGERPCSNHSR